MVWWMDGVWWMMAHSVIHMRCRLLGRVRRVRLMMLLLLPLREREHHRLHPQCCSQPASQPISQSVVHKPEYSISLYMYVSPLVLCDATGYPRVASRV